MPELRTDWLTGRIGPRRRKPRPAPNEFHRRAPLQASPLAADARSRPALRTAPSAPATNPARRRRLRATRRRRPLASSRRAEHVPGRRLLGERRIASSITPAEPPPNFEPAVGAHEVIIESPRHVDRTVRALDSESCATCSTPTPSGCAIGATTADFDYGLVFKNQGPRAGASLAHLHSQLIALPFVPPTVAAELRASRAAIRNDTALCPIADSSSKNGRPASESFSTATASSHSAPSPAGSRTKCG